MSTQATVKRLPNCDVCGGTAKYDTKTIFGPWANLCQDCYGTHGIGKLGTGFGQELVLAEEATK